MRMPLPQPVTALFAVEILIGTALPAVIPGAASWIAAVLVVATGVLGLVLSRRTAGAQSVQESPSSKPLPPATSWLRAPPRSARASWVPP
ncbi:MAG: hypothetical protein IPG61_03720 [bacterium]|nr:hypothetical protein [bacterium]